MAALCRRILGDRQGIATALMYFSDHGESLGEQHLYLYGAPCILSPEEQRHVPFMGWLSDGYKSRFRIDSRGLAARADPPFSHDKLFRCMPGMVNGVTASYNPALDIFRPCDRAT
jgi:lipid A ethanolaminephosphotransferase